jgi:hypothetical protein
MFLVPAWAWRGNAAARAVCVGVPVGAFLAALVFAESGLMLGAAVTFVVISIFYGIVMAWRMSQFWPAARDLSGADRVAVALAARRGRAIEDARLAPAAIEYGGGLRAAREQGRRWQWMVWLGAVAVSWLFVVFFAVEIFWWPRAQNRLLVNAERTGESARRALGQQQTDHA